MMLRMPVRWKLRINASLNPSEWAVMYSILYADKYGLKLPAACTKA